jgi:hypothetical protein
MVMAGSPVNLAPGRGFVPNWPPSEDRPGGLAAAVQQAEKMTRDPCLMFEILRHCCTASPGLDCCKFGALTQSIGRTATVLVAMTRMPNCSWRSGMGPAPLRNSIHVLPSHHLVEPRKIRGVVRFSRALAAREEACSAHGIASSLASSPCSEKQNVAKCILILRRSTLEANGRSSAPGKPGVCTRARQTLRRSPGPGGFFTEWWLAGRD